MIKRVPEEYLTPKDILALYPALQDSFNWGPSDLSKFLSCKLVQGYFYRTSKITVIRKSSILRLIDYVNGRIQSQIVSVHSGHAPSRIDEIYLSPKEVADKFPDLEDQLNWSPVDLGTFVVCRVLDGHYDRRRKSTLIRESSLISLIRYANSVLEAQMVAV